MIKTDHSTNGIFAPGIRAALVIAHPGHELRLYGWLKLARPRVFVLTDGSGHSGSPRIERTTNMLRELSAETGSFYGRFSDAAIYETLLTHQYDLFVNLARELAAQILNERFNCVVGDASDGYNPTHDICRLVVDAAVEMAERASGLKIKNLQFLVTGNPAVGLTAPHAEPICLRLDEATFQQKLLAARNYFELKDEIDALINTHSTESFRSEYLYEVKHYNLDTFSGGEGAFYEQHGKKRVKQGYYRQVIRCDEHVLPLALRLRRSAKEKAHEQIAGSDYNL
jgi:hypothetical protein